MTHGVNATEPVELKGGLWPRNPQEGIVAAGAVLTPAVLTAVAIWVLHSDRLAVLLLFPVALAAAAFAYTGVAISLLLVVALLQMARSAAGLNLHPHDLDLVTALVAVGTVVSQLRLSRLRDLHLPAHFPTQEDEVQSARRRLFVFSNALSAISNSLHLSEVLETALDHCLSLLEVSVGAVHLLDPQTSELELVAQRGISDEFLASVADLKVGDGFSGRVVLTGSPVLLTDAETYPHLVHMVEDKRRLRSFASVPIRNRDRVLGAISIVSHGERVLTQEDVDLVGAIASHLGVAVSNARLYEEVQEGLKRERELKEERLRRAQLEGAVRVVLAVQQRLTTPLMVITSSAEFLLKQAEGLSAELRKVLTRMTRAANEIAEMGEHLARLSVPSTGVPVPEDPLFEGFPTKSTGSEGGGVS